MRMGRLILKKEWSLLEHLRVTITTGFQLRMSMEVKSTTLVMMVSSSNSSKILLSEALITNTATRLDNNSLSLAETINNSAKLLKIQISETTVSMAKDSNTDSKMVTLSCQDSLTQLCRTNSRTAITSLEMVGTKAKATINLNTNRMEGTL